MASAWLGGLGCEPEAGSELDLLAEAWLGRFTGNISPAALTNAYTDWLTHLELSPSKQASLVANARRACWRWAMYAQLAAQGASMDDAHCIDPLPQDKRFLGEGWRKWPFNVISQGFMLSEQWWHRATTEVRGVSRHHEDVVTFTVRQYLDMLAPSNFMWSNPEVLEETFRSQGANLARGAQNAMAEWALGLNGKRPASSFKVGGNVAVTPGKVILRNALMELIEYAPATPSVHAVPLLVVPAWIMKFYILDLSPQNSLVNYLVGRGFTVFMISWKNPQAEDRELSMDDYRQLGLMEAIRVATEVTGSRQVNAVGYCLGGTLLSIAAASMVRDGDHRLASMTLLASQVDFTEPGELSLFIDDSQVSFLESGMWQKGYLDTKEMAGAFQLLNSNDLIWSRRLKRYLLGQPDPESDLMAWNADATRMPYRMHSEYLRQLFLHNDLADGRYQTGGRRIDLGDIRMPIFAVGTLTDHVAPWRSVFKIHGLTRAEVTFLLTSGGHNAGVVSPPGLAHRSFQLATHPAHAASIHADSWQQSAPRHEGSWWPNWVSWLARRSGKRVAPPPIDGQLEDAPGSYVLQP
jgi:polyhydroxyalkanoate synthase